LTLDSLYYPQNKLKKVAYDLANKPICKKEKQLIRRADKVVVQTKKMKDRFIDELQISDEKIKIIYNGVDHVIFSPIKYQEKARKWKEKMELSDKIFLSYFGFLDQNNGIPFLLDALSHFPDQIKKRMVLLMYRI